MLSPCRPVLRRAGCELDPVALIGLAAADAIELI
jgi:hypothetical protein